MKYKNVFVTTILVMIWSAGFSQQDSSKVEYPQAPIPVEVMIGGDYGVYEGIISKQLFASKFNFFNLTNFETPFRAYDVYISNTYFIQSIVSYGLPKGFAVGLGANFQTYNPIKALASISYSHYSRTSYFFIQPSYEIHKDGAFEVYSMFQWIAANEKKIQPYFKVSAYTSWKKEHLYSYHNWRLGINYKGFRVGPAINVKHFGEEFTDALNYGGFVSILIE